MVLGKKKKIRLTQKPNAEDEKIPMDNLPGNCWAQIFKHSVQLWKKSFVLEICTFIYCLWHWRLQNEVPLSWYASLDTLSLRWSCEKEKLNVRKRDHWLQDTNSDKPRQQIKPSCLQTKLACLVLEYFYNDIHHHYFGFFIPRESCKLLPRWIRVSPHFTSWLDAESMSKWGGAWQNLKDLGSLSNSTQS